MTLNQLSASTLRRKLADESGLTLHAGPLTVRVRSRIDSVAEYLHSHYGDFAAADGSGAHVSVELVRSDGIRRAIRPQVTARIDGETAFHPVPLRMAPALFEWGLNWAVACRVHHLLVIHSAVVSRRGRAILLPAPPASGKSTLCAALVTDGWQFGSDEFALVNPETGAIHPMPRPVSLKNSSVALINDRWPDARFGPEVLDAEGTRIRYLRPPTQSVIDAPAVLRARWIVIPQYRPGSATMLEPMSRAAMLAHLADSSYNFSQFGPGGFTCLGDLVERAHAFRLTYSNTDEALAMVDRLDAESRSEDARTHSGTAA